VGVQCEPTFQNSGLDYFTASMYKLAMHMIIPDLPSKVKKKDEEKR
jgi:hypothetical protein